MTLQQCGLTHFYDLRDKLSSEALKPASGLKPFDFLDTIEIKNNRVQFYVEGLHCAACLWLFEKLGLLVEGIETVDVDMGKSVITLSLHPNASLSMIASTISQLGYTPHLLESESQQQDLLKKENRQQLLKIGVAGACAGNIMLMTVPLYGGATGFLASCFEWISAFLMIPVLFYSGASFFKTSWADIKVRRISIDLPIAIAIGVGCSVSLYNLVTGKHALYFDSLSMLVFLLISSRFFLKRIQQNFLGRLSVSEQWLPQFAYVKRDGKDCKTKLADVVKGDQISVYPGQIIPVDGTLITGNAYINLAILTGESTLQRVQPGESVFSGTVYFKDSNDSSPILIETLAAGKDTRMGLLLQGVSLPSAGSILGKFSDKVSQWFLGTVLLLGATQFIWLSATQGFYEALQRFLSLLIVTCPCALALAIPLTQAITMKRAVDYGILLKHEYSIEKIAAIKRIFMDKTGTLTQGSFSVMDCSPPLTDSFDLQVLFALEKPSRHPIAKAIIRYIFDCFPSFTAQNLSVSSYEEKLGEGVFLQTNGDYYAIQKKINGESGDIGFYKNYELITTFYLGDEARKDSSEHLHYLHSQGFSLSLLTGDRISATQALKNHCPFLEIKADLSPEMKKNSILSENPCMFVGDGANDSAALSSASVGVAVHGSLDISIKAADVYMLQPGIGGIVTLIQLCKRSMTIVRCNMIITVIYNGVLGSLAMLGYISPLIAAIGMPISSILVLSMSVVGLNSKKR